MKESGEPRQGERQKHRYTGNEQRKKKRQSEDTERSLEARKNVYRISYSIH
jgi:hypothetical protein